MVRTDARWICFDRALVTDNRLLDATQMLQRARAIELDRRKIRRSRARAVERHERVAVAALKLECDSKIVLHRGDLAFIAGRVLSETRSEHRLGLLWSPDVVEHGAQANARLHGLGAVAKGEPKSFLGAFEISICLQ